MSKKERKNKQTQLQEEIKEIQNKYLCTLAELENTRKRMQKEKTESLSFAIESTISEFLPLIDNFENALNFATNSSEEVKNWAMGFQMILSQLKEILHNHGIVAYHSVGNSFDPHYHEAVEIVETNDNADGSIIEEFAKGYKSAKRVIRPARVKVTKKPLEKKDEKENKNTQIEDCEDNTTKDSKEESIDNFSKEDPKVNQIKI
ncbi:MAG: Protein GrpE [Candidatus Anoxychlamydiales bacterium]|nr:Protein GrpE [Candidatus Anoxychlamydiales bacterium]